jgi:hypothetical protein
MKILAANALPVCALGACAWFVYVGHDGFAAYCMFLAFLTAHTYEKEEKDDA